MIGRTIRLVLFLAGVSSAGVEGIAQSPQIEDFYCENAYTNFASGYQHYGTYVDAQGRVFAFGSESSDPSFKPWQPKQPDSPTRQEMEDKYIHKRRQVGTVDAQKLTEVRRSLTDARKGSLSKKVQKGADMGSAAIGCWVRDAGNDRYRELELDVRGDWDYKNTAPAAVELTRWLQSVAKAREKS